MFGAKMWSYIVHGYYVFLKGYSFPRAYVLASRNRKCSRTTIRAYFRAKWRLLFMYTTRECCKTMLHHAIENTVANTIKVACARRYMGRVDVMP